MPKAHRSQNGSFSGQVDIYSSEDEDLWDENEIEPQTQAGLLGRRTNKRGREGSGTAGNVSKRVR